MNIHGTLFFEGENEFYTECVKDPYDRGYTYERCPIHIPSSFPAAFKYRPDFDPRCTGEYVEVDFQQATEAATQLLKLDIQNINKSITYLTVSAGMAANLYGSGKT